MSLGYAEVIGDPVAQSKSPAIHNFWLGRLGVDAEYRAMRVGIDQIADYLATRREDFDWRGCNVTMPLKQEIIPHLDAIEAPADLIGAVNTVHRIADGQLAGTNSDSAGFLEPLRDELQKQHLFRMARILGTGGAARAIVAALASHGFTIVLAGRNLEKARAILDELAPQGEHHAVDLAHFAQATQFPFDDREGCLDLVINASPLGMRGQPPLRFDWSHAPPGAIAYDIITDPLETEFLKAARAAGHKTIDGLSMLIGQAARGFELFFGQAPPREYDAQLREEILR